MIEVSENDFESKTQKFQSIIEDENEIEHKNDLEIESAQPYSTSYKEDKASTVSQDLIHH